MVWSPNCLPLITPPHKASMYDQFVLGDYRPLIQDAQGNTLDQETQLAPYRRNSQDLLCDSNVEPLAVGAQQEAGPIVVANREWRPEDVVYTSGCLEGRSQSFGFLILLGYDAQPLLALIVFGKL